MMADEGLYEPRVVLISGHLCAWELALVNEMTIGRRLDVSLLIEYHLGI